MSQGTDGSPSTSVTWRVPTEVDRSKTLHRIQRDALVAVHELEDASLLKQGLSYVVCLCFESGRSGTVSAFWWMAGHNKLYWTDAGFDGLPKSIQLKLGYTLKGRRWASFEEAQDALTREIQRGRVLAIEIERQEQMESERRAKAEAEEKARYEASPAAALEDHRKATGSHIMRFFRRTDDSQQHTAFNRYVAEVLTARIKNVSEWKPVGPKSYYQGEVQAVAQRAFLLATILGLLNKDLVLAFLESTSPGSGAQHLHTLLVAELERRMRPLAGSARSVGISYHSLFPEDKSVLPQEDPWLRETCLHQECINLLETRVFQGLVLGDVDKEAAQSLLASSGLDSGRLEEEALSLATAWLSQRQ